MLNRSKEEAEKFIKENCKSFGGAMSQAEVAKELGVTGPRISQMVSKMKANALDEITAIGQETAVEVPAVAIP